MQEIITLSPNALVSTERARDYLGLDLPVSDDAIRRAINHATGVAESKTRRKLKSRPFTFRLDGTGTPWITVPEWPPTLLTSARELSWSISDPIDIDTVGHHLEEGGIVHLGSAIFPRGRQNIELAMTCGYTAALHPEEFYALENAVLRLVQVMFQDWKNQVGRGESAGLDGMTVRLVTDPLPPDVAGILEDFTRII